MVARRLGWVDGRVNAAAAVHNSQLRRNVRNATATIRQRRAGLVAETPDWQELRKAGAEAIRARTRNAVFPQPSRSIPDR